MLYFLDFNKQKKFNNSISTMLSRLPTMLSTPKKEGKVRVSRLGPKNKLHRQLVRGKAVPNRLYFPKMDVKFGRGAEPDKMNRELETGNFEGPGWKCKAITQAAAGRFYKGKHFLQIKKCHF
jgi:hypothetical protein